MGSTRQWKVQPLSLPLTGEIGFYTQPASSLGWPRFSYAHEPGTTAVADKLGSTFSAGRLRVTIALRNKDTQPSQTCSECYTFSATALYRGVSLFWGSIN